MSVDLLLDLSHADSNTARTIIDQLNRRDGLAAITRRAHCTLPTGLDLGDVTLHSDWSCAPSSQGLQLSNLALAAAARAGLPLLVIKEPIIASNEAVATLVEALGTDPMFGFAVARVADENGALFKIAEDLGDPAIRRLPRSVLSALPDYYIIPETVGSCFVLRREVVANLGELDANFTSTAGAWLHYLCRARRAGFRGVIVNRAVVTTPLTHTVSAMYPVRDEYWSVHRQFPCLGHARQEFDRSYAHEYESLLARATSPDSAVRKTLFVDGSGVEPVFNGTAACVVGILGGLAAARQDWQITALLRPESRTFHGLLGRYPELTICETVPECRFTAAIRLSQPFAFCDLRRLHNRALLNFYVILDTISWDVMYNGSIPDVLEETWRFVAACSDGILYNSDFTRQRFAVRFPPSPPVRHLPCYHSFHKDEYVSATHHSSGRGQYILIVGNTLDHKWVQQTANLLATAFPFETFRALGSCRVEQPNVTAIQAGTLPSEELEQLYSDARIVVIPSFYEGFGLPAVKALNYGKPVIVRRCMLYEEIAAHCRCDGQMYTFADPMELVDRVSALLDGRVPEGQLRGSALKDGEEPMRWADVARTILGFIEEGLHSLGDSQWLRREHIFRLLQGGRS